MDLASVMFLTLKAAFSVAVLYGFYRFVLRKETHFAINRAFLLLAVLVSVITPFITITIIQNVVMHQVAPSVTVLESSQSMGAPLTAYDQPLSPIEMVGVAYLTITGCMLFRLLLILLNFILSVSRNSRRETINGRIVLVSSSYSQTFSFFGVVVMPESDFQRADRHLLVAHEQVHSRQLHSIDLLLAELFIAIQWFNPISYLLRDSLHEVHEYLADRCVIRGGADQLSYKRLLLDCITTANMPTLSSSFSAKLSKRRFAMISKTYNSGNQKYKFLLALPIAVALFALFSLKVEAKYIYSRQEALAKVDEANDNVTVEAGLASDKLEIAAKADTPTSNLSIEVKNAVPKQQTIARIELLNAPIRVESVYSKQGIIVKVEAPTSIENNQVGVEISPTKKLILECNQLVPDGTFLKDFAFEQLQPNEERNHSLVLTAGNKYCIASASNSSSLEIVLLFQTNKKDALPLEPKTRKVKEMRTSAEYEIAETAVYTLSVRNNGTKPFDMGVSLFVMKL